MELLEALLRNNEHYMFGGIDMTIIQETIIQADVQLLWRAWTESARITEWFAPAAEIEPKTGGKFELYFNPTNRESMCTAGCTLLQYDEPRILVKVSFRPEMDGGTRITLEHTGWMDTVASLQAREWHVDAWKGMLASLKSSIESGEGILCCQ
jgi:uncharacterized protein YndB with AHSA1/START domain